MIEWWRRLGTTSRAVTVVLGVLLAVHLGTTLLDGALGRGPSGVPSSSFATTPAGVSAWATLLEEHGHEVTKLRTSLDRTRLDPGSTVVVVDPARVEPFESAALQAFVSRGGSAVLAGEASEPLLLAIASGTTWQAGGAVTATVVDETGELAHLRTITTRGAGSWRVADGARARATVVGDAGPVVVRAEVGTGRVVALADSSPLTNELLPEADNAALALAVVGDEGRPVLFAEAAHGYGDGALGLDDLPRGWATTVIGAALVTAALLWSRAKRFGPPNEEHEVPVPPRRAYVDAIAATTARSSSTGDPIAPLRHRARRRLARRAGIDPAHSDAELRAAARRAGVDDELVNAVIDGSTIAVGVAAARLEGS